MQQQRVEEKQVDLPPSASRSGKNTTYIGCDVRHSRQNYGVCLFVIQAYDEDRLDKNMSECARAITGGYCTAEKTRQEEKEAGKALYFKEREIKVTVVSDKKEQPVRSVDKQSPSYLRGWNSVGGKAKRPTAAPVSRQTPPKKTARKVKTVDAFEKSLVDGRNDLASTLTEVAKKESKPVKQAKVETKTETKTETKDTANDARIKRAQRIAQLMKGKQNA